MTANPYPKKHVRHVATREEYRELRREVLKTGRCVVKDCATPATDCHHLIPRSLGGSDVLVNLVGMCHEHHMAYEDKVPGWQYVAYSIREALSEEQVDFLTSVKSVEWLRRYLPSRDFK